MTYNIISSIYHICDKHVTPYFGLISISLESGACDQKHMREGHYHSHVLNLIEFQKVVGTQ
jgi:hypothetical protein